LFDNPNDGTDAPLGALSPPESSSARLQILVKFSTKFLGAAKVLTTFSSAEEAKLYLGKIAMELKS
jgi:hypothetical protein